MAKKVCRDRRDHLEREGVGVGHVGAELDLAPVAPGAVNIRHELRLNVPA